MSKCQDPAVMIFAKILNKKHLKFSNKFKYPYVDNKYHHGRVLLVNQYDAKAVTNF